MIQGFSSGLIGNRELIYETDLPSFQRDFASLKTLDHGTGPNIAFTRASNATFFDANGVLQTASNDAPRFDHDPATGASRGLLIEEARTNSIRNSQAGGAVAGTPGTLPTNWITATLPSGISREVVASGTANGFNYVDLKFSGTSTASGFIQIYPESLTQVVASSGQSWTGSLYLAVAAGSTSNITDTRVNVVERDSSGTSLASSNLTVTLSGTLARYALTRTLNDASTTRVSVQFNGSIASGVTIDITLRIAAPQLEQGAFPTSYIPTTNAAATRATESAIVESPLFATAYNNSEGSLFGEYIFYHSVPSMRMLQIDNTTNDERLCLALTSGSSPQNFGQSGGVSVLSSTPAIGSVSVNTIYKTAAAFAANNMISASNGTLGVLDSSGAMPVGPLGRVQVSGNTARGHWIRKVAYWPKRLSDTLLQQITT